MSQFTLLARRRFAPFFATQALSAFNDNAFRYAMIGMATFRLSLSQNALAAYSNIALALFIAPFFLFSASAGQLAERVDKAVLIRRIKLLELGVMLLAAAAFGLQSLNLMLAVLFLMGLLATLFGPIKYAILPQALHAGELVGGNGLVEMGTSLSILLGTVAGNALMAVPRIGPELASAAVLGVAIAGYLASRAIPPAPASAPDLDFDWNPWRQTLQVLGHTRRDRTVFNAVLGISWFWFFGATLTAQLPLYTRAILGGNASVLTMVLTLFSIGVGIGSLLCEKLSGGNVEPGLVPLGAFGMTVFGVDLYFVRPHAAAALNQDWWRVLTASGGWHVALDLMLIGMVSGVYIVPLFALVQSRAPHNELSRIIAGTNIINALFMVAAAGFGIGLLTLGLNVPQLFLVVALMNAAVATYIFTLVPEFPLRFIDWVLVNTLYRIRKQGLEHVPRDDAALLVCNHVSFMDPLILMACVPRPVRFVMDYRIYRLPLLQPLFRMAGAIPIAGHNQDHALLQRAFDAIDAALADGEVVCIFPEGGLSADGDVAPFRSGVERILDRRPVPVVPVALSGLWGSVFSRRDTALDRPRLPRRWRARIDLVVGAPVAADMASARALQDHVTALRRERRLIAQEPPVARNAPSFAPAFAGITTVARLQSRSEGPAGDRDQCGDGQPHDQHAPQQPARIGQFQQRIAGVLGVTVAGLDIGIHAGTRHGAEKPAFQRPRGAVGRHAPSTPGLHHGVVIRDQRHGDDHQRGRQPVQHFQKPQCAGPRIGIHRHRGLAIGQLLCQPVAQRAHRPQQKEPEQHREPPPQCRLHGRLHPGRRMSDQVGGAGIRTQPLRRGMGSGWIGGIQHGLDVRIQLARPQGIDQHDHREQRPEHAEQRQRRQGDGDGRTHAHRQQQGDGDTASAPQAAQLPGPACEPVEAPPTRQMRHRGQQRQHDQDNKHSQDHCSLQGNWHRLYEDAAPACIPISHVPPWSLTMRGADQSRKRTSDRRKSLWGSGREQRDGAACLPGTILCPRAAPSLALLEPAYAGTSLLLAMFEQLDSGVLAQPVGDQLPGNRDPRGEHHGALIDGLEQRGGREPAGIFQLAVAQFDVACRGGGGESQHQRGRKWPRLRGMVTRGKHVDAGLLGDLARHGRLQRLARLDEARKGGIAVLRPAGLTTQEAGAIMLDDDDDGRVGARKFRVAARIALPTVSRRHQRQGAAAGGAIACARLPVRQGRGIGTHACVEIAEAGAGTAQADPACIQGLRGMLRLGAAQWLQEIRHAVALSEKAAIPTIVRVGTFGGVQPAHGGAGRIGQDAAAGIRQDESRGAACALRLEPRRIVASLGGTVELGRGKDVVQRLLVVGRNHAVSARQRIRSRRTSRSHMWWWRWDCG